MRDDGRVGKPVDLRLSRRGLFAGVLAAATLSACEGGPGITPTPTASFDPPDDAPIAVWQLAGGLTLAGMDALRPPRLVVYGDGDTIADAAYRSRLDPDELQSLANALADDLRSTAAQKQPTVTPTIADAPVTTVSVWSAAGTLTFSAEGLDELRTDHLYADAYYDARDRLATIHKAVSTTAQPYLATRVRVVAVAVAGSDGGAGQGGTGGDASPTAGWPVEVQLPPADAAGLRRADLDGDAARAAVRMLTRDLDQRGAWPVYRIQDGSIVRASWRYLLPNE